MSSIKELSNLGHRIFFWKILFFLSHTFHKVLKFPIEILLIISAKTGSAGDAGFRSVKSICGSVDVCLISTENIIFWRVIFPSVENFHKYIYVMFIPEHLLSNVSFCCNYPWVLWRDIYICWISYIFGIWYFWPLKLLPCKTHDLSEAKSFQPTDELKTN
jgi:hypothetical protein